MKLIYNNKSLLLIKKIFININKLKEFIFNNIKVSPFIILLICHYIYLLNYLTSVFYKSII